MFEMSFFSQKESCFEESCKKMENTSNLTISVLPVSRKQKNNGNLQIKSNKC